MAVSRPDLPAGWSWASIRTELNPKERYFNQFARQFGLMDEPSIGRQTLSIETACRYDLVR